MTKIRAGEVGAIWLQASTEAGVGVFHNGYPLRVANLAEATTRDVLSVFDRYAVSETSATVCGCRLGLIAPGNDLAVFETILVGHDVSPGVIFACRSS